MQQSTIHPDLLKEYQMSPGTVLKSEVNSHNGLVSCNAHRKWKAFNHKVAAIILTFVLLATTAPEEYLKFQECIRISRVWGTGKE